MADKTSARIFGSIFRLLAEDPTDSNKKIAREMFKKTFDYDFCNYQMYADESLVKLEIAIADNTGGGDYRYLKLNEL